MGVKVTGCCCFQPLLAHHPSSSFSSKTRWTNGGEDGSLTFHMPANKLPPNRCSKFSTKRSTRKSLSRAIISLHSFTDDDDNEAEDEHFISRRLQDDGSRGSFRTHPDSKNLEDSMNPHHRQVKDSDISSFRNALQPLWPAVHPVPTPNWKEPDGILPASVEIKANSVDLPLSLRILKHKKKKKKNMKKNTMQEAGKSAVRKAFSSMVFMVRELQSYSLQTWEVLSYTNLKVILARVQDEMNASFVWLFQHIFSSTPTLMLYLMLLLANFTAYSISDNFPATAAVSQVEVQETHQQQQRFDTCATKSLSVGKTAAVGGGSGGGGKVRPVAGATDDGQSGSSCHISRSIVSGQELGEEEDDDIVWKRVVEEASRMQASLRDEALMDRDTLRMLVAPVSVEVEGDGEYWEYKQTELMYSQAILQDPENVLILANFAQFLFIVLHDHDRAEYYFKRAVKASNPADAEALSQYANFLWLARNDLGAAEETYLEAIAADPGNPNHAANYAHFLWNTGGQDTCYPPLDDSNDTC